MKNWLHVCIQKKKGLNTIVQTKKYFYPTHEFFTFCFLEKNSCKLQNEMWNRSFFHLTTFMERFTAENEFSIMPGAVCHAHFVIPTAVLIFRNKFLRFGAKLNFKLKHEFSMTFQFNQDFNSLFFFSWAEFIFTDREWPFEL